MSKVTKNDVRGSAVVALVLALICITIVGVTVYVVLQANQRKLAISEASFRNAVEAADKLIEGINANVRAGKITDTKYCFDDEQNNKDLICNSTKSVSYEAEGDEDAAQLAESIVNFIDANSNVMKKIDPPADLTDKTTTQEIIIDGVKCEVMTFRMFESVSSWTDPSPENDKKRTVSSSATCKSEQLKAPIYRFIENAQST